MAEIISVIVGAIAFLYMVFIGQRTLREYLADRKSKVFFNIIGLKSIYHRRGILNTTEWRKFYQNTKSELDIMGHSMLGVFKDEEDRNIIKNLLRKNVTIRILLLNPYELFFQQLEETDKKLPLKLKDKIQKTINFISDIKSEAIKNNYPGKLIIKVTNSIMYCAISRSDNKMYVNPYSVNPEGDETPLLLLEGNKNGIFTFYKEEFKKMWESSSYIEETFPELNIKYRIIKYFQSAKKIKEILDGNNFDILPYPKMVIVYPTYRCEISCPHCMYKHFIANIYKGNLDIKTDRLTHLIEDLSNLEIENIEFSGGGDPLNHPDINDIFEKVVRIKQSKERKGQILRYGLLTNGLNIKKLNDSVLQLIIKSFAYIRLSCSEQIYPKNESLYSQFFQSLEGLIKLSDKYTIRERARIGAKLLLTNENKEDIFRIVKDLYNKGVDHLKIKSIRGPKNIEIEDKEILKIEEELYNLKFGNPKYRDLNIDLRKSTFYPKFKCWINPIITVIDPNGRVYICFNYHNDPRNTIIGSYEQHNSFKEFWGNIDHQNIIKHINIDKICKAEDACNCRLQEYQDIIENLLKQEKAINLILDKSTIENKLESIGLKNVGNFL